MLGEIGKDLANLLYAAVASIGVGTLYYHDSVVTDKLEYIEDNSKKEIVYVERPVTKSIDVSNINCDSASIFRAGVLEGEKHKNFTFDFSDKNATIMVHDSTLIYIIKSDTLSMITGKKIIKGKGNIKIHHTGVIPIKGVIKIDSVTQHIIDTLKDRKK